MLGLAAIGAAGVASTRSPEDGIVEEPPSDAPRAVFPAGELIHQPRFAFVVTYAGHPLDERTVRAAIDDELRAAWLPPAGDTLFVDTAVSGSRAATGIAVRSSPGRRARLLLRATERGVLRLARDRDGSIRDESTREMFTPDAFEQQRLPVGALCAADEIAIRAVRRGERVRLVTSGMEKFGLPDIVVEQAHSAQPLNAVVTLAAQLLVEGVRIPPDGAFELALNAVRDAEVHRRITGTLHRGAIGRATALALDGVREDGDPDNALVELWFGDPADRRQAQAVARIWGSEAEAALLQ